MFCKARIDDDFVAFDVWRLFIIYTSIGLCYNNCCAWHTNILFINSSWCNALQLPTMNMCLFFSYRINPVSPLDVILPCLRSSSNILDGKRVTIAICTEDTVPLLSLTSSMGLFVKPRSAALTRPSAAWLPRRRSQKARSAHWNFSAIQPKKMLVEKVLASSRKSSKTSTKMERRTANKTHKNRTKKRLRCLVQGRIANLAQAAPDGWGTH